MAQAQQSPPPVVMLKGHEDESGFGEDAVRIPEASKDWMAVSPYEIGAEADAPLAEVSDPGEFSFGTPEPSPEDEAFVSGGKDYETAMQEWRSARDQARVEHRAREKDFNRYQIDKSVADRSRVAEARRRYQAIADTWDSVKADLRTRAKIDDQQLDSFLAAAHISLAGPDGKEERQIRAGAQPLFDALLSEGGRMPVVFEHLVKNPRQASRLFAMNPVVASRKVGMLIGQMSAQQQQKSANSQEVGRAIAGSMGSYSLN